MAPPIPINRHTGAAMMVDHELTELFDGHAFTVQYESVAPLPTNIGEETAIGFLTPAAAVARIHLTVDAWADDESVLEIREDPTIVLGGGLAAIPLNRERSGGASAIRDNDVGNGNGNSVNTYTVAQANAADLAIGTGNILHHETLAVGAGPPFGSMMNGVVRSQRGFLLLPETEYVVILTSSTVNDTVHNIVLNWHEHIDAHYGH